MEDFLKIYGALIGAIVVVSVALCGWLYSLYKGLTKKDDELKNLIHGVEKKFERLDEKFNSLKENNDQVLATLAKQIPDIHHYIEQDTKGKKK